MEGQVPGPKGMNRFVGLSSYSLKMLLFLWIVVYSKHAGSLLLKILFLKAIFPKKIEDDFFFWSYDLNSKSILGISI